MTNLLYIFLIPWYLFAYSSQAQAYANFPHDSTMEVFSKKGKKGIRKESGRILLEAKYQAFGWSNNSTGNKSGYIGYQQNNLWGLMSADFKVISKPKYNSLTPFGDDLFIISKRSKYSKILFYGLIKANGRSKIKASYRNIYAAGDYLITATKKEHDIYFGVMNSGGKVVVPFEYFHISYLGQTNFLLTKESGHKELIKLSPKPQKLLDQIDSVSIFRDGVAIIFKNGKQGLIRQDGKILLPVNYKKIEWNKGTHIYVTPLDEWTILNPKGKNIEKQKADSIFYLNDSVLVKNTSSFAQIFNVRTNENKQVFNGDILDVFGSHYILKNSNSTYIAKSSDSLLSDKFYGEVKWNNDFFVAKKRTFQGYENIIINKQGHSMVSDSFYFSNEYIALKTKKNWGIYDKDLKEIIPPLYEKIIPNASHYIVKFKDQYGVINQENEWIIPPRYIMVEAIDDSHYKLVNKYLREFTSNGKDKSEALLYYDFYGEYGVEQDASNEFRLIDHEGNPLSDFRKGTYTGHGKSGILFRNGDFHFLLNKEGVEQFTINNCDTLIFSDDDYIAIKKNGQWGFISNNGLLRIANRYDSVRPFYSERAAVKIRNAWGFINRQEEIVVQPYYSEISDYNQNTAYVRINRKYGLIDENGEFIIEAEYDEITKVKSFYLLRKGSRWGIANSKGKVITYPTYDQVRVEDNFLKVEKYGSVRILNPDGSNLIDEQFDNVYYDSRTEVFLGKKTAKKEQVFLTDILSGEYP